jgi:hypothetical protein
VLRPPSIFDPARSDEIFHYTCPEYTGPALRIPPDKSGLTQVEYFSGRVEEAVAGGFSSASIVDKLMFQEDRNNYVAILRARAKEEKQLDEENQDLAAGQEVLYLPTVVLEEIKTSVDMWIDHFVRPSAEILSMLTNRRRLWRTEGVAAVIEKPARDVGKHFRLIRTGDGRPAWADWHQVRRKF